MSDRSDPLWWHVLLLLALGVVNEASYLTLNVNPTDEGWPLYAAARVLSGELLYRDAFWVFPPGHLLVARIAVALDFPGVMVSRLFYAGFNLALSLSLYALGRRLMPPGFALLGALLLTVAAPKSHSWQLLFGYRYLVFSVLSLLAFARRLGTGRARWMLVSGLLAGTALCFRLTPAFAVMFGVGAGVLAAAPRPRRWLTDGAAFAAGAALVTAPVVLWFAHSVGLGTFLREAVQRPIEMTRLQSLPVPDLFLPSSWTREEIADAFDALLFRLPWLLYAAYGGILAWRYVADRTAGRPFPYALLTAVVVWGAVFFGRSLGRSDVAHLDSAIPPVCLLGAHALCAALRRVPGAAGASPAARRRLAAAAGAAVFALWAFLLHADHRFEPAVHRQIARTVDAIRRPVPIDVFGYGREVWAIRRRTAPGDIVLDLSGAPMFYVLSGRPGPGGADVLMPGTLRDEQEERAFVARLMRRKPALVVVRKRPFDDLEERSLLKIAPSLALYLGVHYRRESESDKYIFLVPRELRERLPDEVGDDE